jgi:hypothetical protein
MFSICSVRYCCPCMPSESIRTRTKTTQKNGIHKIVQNNSDVSCNESTIYIGRQSTIGRSGKFHLPPDPHNERRFRRSSRSRSRRSCLAAAQSTLVCLRQRVEVVLRKLLQLIRTTRLLDTESRGYDLQVPRTIRW